MGFRVFLLLVTTWGWSPSAHADTCARLFGKAKYRMAAGCYERRIEKVGSPTAATGLQAIVLDRLLRHGAIAYQKAAQATPNIEHKGYLYEQAVRLLLRSFRGGSCMSTRRCRTHRLLADRLKAQIRYTPLIVLTGRTQAVLVLVGYRYKSRHQKQLQRRLRPGTYTLHIRLPGQKPKQKRLRLRPGLAMTVNVTPYTIKVVVRKILIAKKLPLWIGLGYVVGGALAIGGAVMISLSVVEQFRLNEIILDPIANQSLHDDEFHQRFDGAQVLKVVGVVIGGLGVAVLGAGAILHVLFRQRAKAPPPKAPTKRGSSLLHSPP